MNIFIGVCLVLIVVMLWWVCVTLDQIHDVLRDRNYESYLRDIAAYITKKDEEEFPDPNEQE